MVWGVALVAGGELVLEVNPEDWVKDCYSIFHDTCCQQTPGRETFVQYSSYDVVEAPSGLCLPEFSCAWDGCVPSNYGKSVHNYAGPFMSDFVNLAATTFEEIEAAMPGISLPSMISFPTKASDIVKALEYATEKGLQVSIISTGHSYTKASSAGGTLQLNMREYPKYSATSITECDTAVLDDPDHPDHVACKLAVDRGKPAVMRVGGGEKFNNTANAVFAVRDETTGFAKYQMLHGVGTVGAAGGG